MEFDEAKRISVSFHRLRTFEQGKHAVLIRRSSCRKTSEEDLKIPTGPEYTVSHAAIFNTLKRGRRLTREWFHDDFLQPTKDRFTVIRVRVTHYRGNSANERAAPDGATGLGAVRHTYVMTSGS